MLAKISCHKKVRMQLGTGTTPHLFVFSSQILKLSLLPMIIIQILRMMKRLIIFMRGGELRLLSIVRRCRSFSSAILLSVSPRSERSSRWVILSSLINKVSPRSKQLSRWLSLLLWCSWDFFDAELLKSDWKNSLQYMKLFLHTKPTFFAPFFISLSSFET